MKTVGAGLPRPQPIDRPSEASTSGDGNRTICGEITHVVAVSVGAGVELGGVGTLVVALAGQEPGADLHRHVTM